MMALWNTIIHSRRKLILILVISSHIGMDGPNVNLAFGRKLANELEELGTSFLKLGSCSLHPIHNSQLIEKGLRSYPLILIHFLMISTSFLSFRVHYVTNTLLYQVLLILLQSMQKMHTETRMAH